MSKNEALQTARTIRKIRKSLEFHRCRAAKLELELEKLTPPSPAENPRVWTRTDLGESPKASATAAKIEPESTELRPAEENLSLFNPQGEKEGKNPGQEKNRDLEGRLESSPPQAAEKEEKPLPTSGAGPAKRILVVDDDPTTINIITHFLEKENYAVSSSRSGVEGLKRVFKEKPDLILLDILMPDLNGFQFLSILTKDEESARIPVVIISSLAEEADVLRGLRIGAADFVTKPFSPQVLITKVRKNLDSRP
jgi:twitching motility two-component system response regulator PilH